MAMSLNRVQLIGNATRDPELRQIPGGQTVASFSVATNFVWTDTSGQRQEKAEFHNIVAWRKLADIVGQFVKKGSKIYVEGRLQTREWEGEDGVKRYRTEIVADNVILLDRKGVSSEGGEITNFNGGYRKAGSLNTDAKTSSENKAYQENSAPVSAENPVVEEVTIEDLPF